MFDAVCGTFSQVRVAEEIAVSLAAVVSVVVVEVRGALHVLHLFLLLLGRGHLSCVLLTPFGSTVLEPDLQPKDMKD